MQRLRVLVTAAAGKTGTATVRALLARGFSVRAMVRRHDARAVALARAGAELAVGSLDDIADVRAAMRDTQRAYFCPPLAPGALRRAAVFAEAADEARLDGIVALSQWLCDPRHPASHAGEKWLAARLFARLRGPAVATIEPGFFADNYMASLESVVHFGIMPMPLGDGTNAPPSNEDIGRVAAAALADPERYAGRRLRPTGPARLTPQEIAAAFGRVLGRRVTYRAMPVPLFLKAARVLGYDDFVINQLYWFLLDYQRDAFGIGAPTTVVEELTGEAPEPFEAVAQRSLAASGFATRSPASFARAAARLLRTLAASTPRPAAIARRLGLPEIAHATLAADSPAWLATHAGEAEERSPARRPAEPADFRE